MKNISLLQLPKIITLSDIMHVLKIIDTIGNIDPLLGILFNTK